MRHIIKNKQLYFLGFIIIVIGCFLGNSVKNNFLEAYIGNMGNISIRYFLIIISLAMEYIVYKTLNNSCIISRYENKQKFLKESIKIEIILSIIIFSIFNLLVLLISLPSSIKYIIDIGIINVNIILIYITISLLIKMINVFIKTHYISSIVFIFMYVSFEFILEHFNFFYFNNKLFDLGTIYKIFYMYKNSIVYFIFIIFLNTILFAILNLNVKRKDYILKSDEEIQ